MQIIDRRRYEMVARVRDFGSSYGHLFPEDSGAYQAFGNVARTVEEIEAQDLAESSATVSARAAWKIGARKALVDRLVLVGKTARLIHDADPEFKAYFELPDSAGDTHVLTTARQFVAKATPVAARFVADGWPATFLSDLEGLIDNFEAELRDRGQSRGDRVAARSTIKGLLEEAIRTASKLDVMVAYHLAPHAAARAVWKSIRRVDYPWPKGRRVAAKPAADDAATPAAPPPVPPIPSSAGG